MKKRIRRTTYDTDRLMLRIGASLVDDFRTNLNDLAFASAHLKEMQKGDVKKLRQLAPLSNFDTTAYRFKAEYQIDSVFKRYRFKNDLYTDAELRELTINKFLSVQDHLRNHDFPIHDALFMMLVNQARKFIHRVIGEYDDDECRSLCRFGRRASYGIPARSANLAAKLQVPISGSPSQQSWFQKEISDDWFLTDYLRNQLSSDPHGSTFQDVTCLRLALVPKTFKSLRVIMPNTTIGSYMSYGQGELIRKRLKAAGYNISTLQTRHRELALKGSRHQNLVTVDLSSASDCITDALVKMLLPSSWYDVLSLHRVTHVDVAGVPTRMETFCTMGIGYTFPLQTLIFLSLMHAVKNSFFWNEPKAVISAYGDDMIMSSYLYPSTERLLRYCGFIINDEKTFVEGGFRESCGGDYYHGVDVRPFQIQGGSGCKTRLAYEAFLYKCINGLLMRWHRDEIPSTTDILLGELSMLGQINIVPHDFPSDSGILADALSPPSWLRGWNVRTPKHIGHGVFRFRFLTLKANLREEKRHGPYYWDVLRGSPDSDGCIYSRTDHGHSGSYPHFDQSPAQAGIDQWITAGSERFIRQDDPSRTYRSKLTGKRRKCELTLVPILGTGTYTRQTGNSSFGCPGK